MYKKVICNEADIVAFWPGQDRLRTQRNEQRLI